MPQQPASGPNTSDIAALGEPEALKTLVEHLPFGAALFTMAGHLLAHNPEFARIYGMDRPHPPGLLPEGLDPSELTIWQLIEVGHFDHLFDDAHRVFTETFQSLERGEDHYKTTEAFGRLIEVHDRPIGNGLIISTHADVTDRIHAQQEAEYLAWHDPLTGLPNRTKLLDDISGAERHPAVVELDGTGLRPLRVVAISIEPYRRVLATLGYNYSDAMMRAAVTRLKTETVGEAKLYDLREGVLAVLVRSHSTEDTVRYAYRLAKSLSEPLIAKGIPILAECRLGIAGLVAEADNSVTAIRAALAALEDARDQHSIVAVYDADRDERRHRTVSLLADFQDALASDIQLRLFLQPKIDLETQRCNGFEALLRWHHPDRGAVPPDVFIPIVEKTGLMKLLTEWVVKAALEQLVRFGREGIDLPIAVNISVHDLERRTFAEWLGRQLREFGVAADRLQVEVTESAVMRDPDGALRTLSDLRRMGISVALDDFGTGQSSLAYLKDMAIDVVKLDRSLIRHLNDDRRSYALVKAVMDLSGSFGFSTVAEGIEDAVTARRLAELGCRTGQGYHYAKPMPPDAVAAWLYTGMPMT